MIVQRSKLHNISHEYNKIRKGKMAPLSPIVLMINDPTSFCASSYQNVFKLNADNNCHDYALNFALHT